MRYQERKNVRTTAATERVFRLPELLEAILIHLPMRDLLFVQRVDVRFRRLVSSSRMLRHALFLEPAPASINGKDVTPEIDPLLPRESDCERLINLPIMVTPMGEPFTIKVTIVRKAGSVPSIKDACYAKGYEADIRELYLQKCVPDEMRGSPEGSWRHMLLTQPRYQMKWSKNATETSESRSITRLDGREMGDFYTQEGFITGRAVHFAYFMQWAVEHSGDLRDYMADLAEKARNVEAAE